MITGEAINLLKALSDRSRILLINALFEKPMYVEELSKRLDLAVSTVSFHLKKLEDCGLVFSEKEQYYVMYEVKKSLLDLTLKELVLFSPGDDGEKKNQDSRFEEYRRKVVDNFFEYGKLKAIPSQRKKRMIILEEIAKNFEAGKIYPEREVNMIIADFNDDFCAIRRELVGEKLLDRDAEGKKYWRNHA